VLGEEVLTGQQSVLTVVNGMGRAYGYISMLQDLPADRSVDNFTEFSFPVSPHPHCPRASTFIVVVSLNSGMQFVTSKETSA